MNFRDSEMTFKEARTAKLQSHPEKRTTRSRITPASLFQRFSSWIFVGGVIFLMIYMMIIFQSPFFFLEVTFPFISRCVVLSLFGKKSKHRRCFHKKMISLPRSSLLSELALNSCWKPWRRCDSMVRVVRLGRVKTWVDSSCSLVN